MRKVLILGLTLAASAVSAQGEACHFGSDCAFGAETCQRSVNSCNMCMHSAWTGVCELGMSCATERELNEKGEFISFFSNWDAVCTCEGLRREKGTFCLASAPGSNHVDVGLQNLNQCFSATLIAGDYCGWCEHGTRPRIADLEVAGETLTVMQCEPVTCGPRPICSLGVPSVDWDNDGCHDQCLEDGRNIQSNSCPEIFACACRPEELRYNAQTGCFECNAEFGGFGD